MSDLNPHKFRYLLPPGSNFQFVARFRMFTAISLLLMAACVGALFVNKVVRGKYLNWSIDFSGGTELVFAFHPKTDAAKYVTVSSGEVRAALTAAGEEGVDVSDISWTENANGVDTKVSGIIVRTPRFSALNDAKRSVAVENFTAKFTDREIQKANWSGERLYVRSKKPIGIAEATPVLAENGLEAKTWSEAETAAFAIQDESSHEYNQVFSIWGLDRQLSQVIEKAKPEVTAKAVQAYAVGAKAGDKLRNDALQSIIYAMFLIMLYLVFRFDIRYAPGAAFATLHDAVMVVGVFAVTWTEVSLTSVAALLTVIGYSVNDTVIIFDRIRENQAKLHGKTLERIIDISLNETLVRSILTSLTVFATTLLMNVFAEGLVRNFAFAMNIGVVVGTYSSIFFAAPVFYWISRTWYTGPVKRRRGAALTAEP